MSALPSTSSFVGNASAFKLHTSAKTSRKEVLPPTSALRGRSLQNTPEGVSIDKKGADFFKGKSSDEYKYSVSRQEWNKEQKPTR